MRADDQSYASFAVESSVIPDSADMTTLADTAIQVNEFYKTFVDGGFSERQSLWLCGCILTGNPGLPSLD